MAKFKLVLERTDTITKQTELIVEATSAEQARRFILADLGVDAGSYDDLRVVEDGVGEMMVKVESGVEAPVQASPTTGNVPMFSKTSHWSD